MAKRQSKPKAAPTTDLHDPKPVTLDAAISSLVLKSAVLRQCCVASARDLDNSSSLSDTAAQNTLVVAAAELSDEIFELCYLVQGQLPGDVGSTVLEGAR
jgi:hypothetical protein